MCVGKKYKRTSVLFLISQCNQWLCGVWTVKGRSIGIPIYNNDWVNSKCLKRKLKMDSRSKLTIYIFICTSKPHRNYAPMEGIDS